MYKSSLSELQNQLRQRDISSTELTQYFFDRIKRYDSQINSFITLCEEEALTQAQQADQLLAQGTSDPLAGIPIAHKDIFCTQGIKTTCGSKMLHNFIAPYNATVTTNLAQANTILVGKTNMDEFAMGSSNETSYYGPTCNPWKPQCVPGGSSGGSAAAVAAGLVPAATGTDTGGSIRQPVALCGVTGLKPTYGRVSRYGMVAFASSLDQAGPIGRTAECVAYLLNAMAGPDPKDSTCVDQSVPDYTAHLNDPIQGLTIGLPTTFFDQDIDAEVAKTIEQSIEIFKKLGAQIKEVQLPHAKVSLSAYYIIAPAECSSNLARYDGVRYGHRCENPQNLEDLYKRTRSEGFGEEVKRRIMTGTYALSAGYYEAYYGKAQKIRQLISNDFAKAFESVDAILTPTTPTAAFELGAKTKDPVAMYLSDVFTIPVNMAGLPGISLPAGFVDQRPVGLQLIGNYFDEARLLNIAHQFQQNTEWHQHFPEGFES